jgi:GNAT superfamily N-acetyltransferase
MQAGELCPLPTRFNLAAMTLCVAPLTGPSLLAALDDLARLRIAVFRDYPYLYDGTPGYELGYLRVFARGRDGVIVVARDDGEIVGCATGSALETQDASLRAPFEKAGYNVDEIFYCGESVLLPQYRGQGIGHIFFEEREKHARAKGYRFSVFCVVVRPDDHAARPSGYRPLDAFWKTRGYARMDGVTAQLSWTDIGDTAPTDKPMQFWLKAL